MYNIVSLFILCSQCTRGHVKEKITRKGRYQKLPKNRTFFNAQRLDISVADSTIITQLTVFRDTI